MSNEASEDGFAVPLAVGVLSILSLVCSLLFLEARDFKRSVTSALLLARARNTADGAIYKTIFDLVSSRDLHGPIFDGSPSEVTVGDARVIVRITSESAKIDINLASQDVLTALFQSVGASGELASSLAQRAVEWRRSDGGGNIQEIAVYSGAGIGYSPRFAPFLTTSELNFIPGMSTDLAEKLDDLITVRSKDGFVDRSLASGPVLQSLAANGDGLAAAELMARQNHAPSVRRRAAPGEAFTIEAKAPAGSIVVKRRALVALRWDQGRAFDLLSLQ